MKTWTCIARCGICKAELNRATGVPDDEKTKVIISAPMVAICNERSHNTLSDLNLKVELEWIEENESQPTPNI